MAKQANSWEQIPTPVYQRIFGIGMNKTGTSSLKRCFKILSLHPIAPTSGSSPETRRANRRLFKKGEYEPALRLAQRYRAFEDRPWNVWEMYKHLDSRFPDSRFILTVRDPDNWWRSVERWVTIVKPWMAEKYRIHLRSPSLHKHDMISCYLQYNREVIEYFEGNESLLVMDIEKGDGWKPVCAFLDCPVPEKPFPHANRMTYDRRDLERTFKKGMTKYLRFTGNGPISACDAVAELIANEFFDSRLRQWRQQPRY